MFRKLDDTISVSPQIGLDDVAAAKAQGFRTIVNNRPDGEQPGQISAAEIGAAAADAGLAYVTIPVDPSGFDQEQVDAMAKVLEDADGPILAFCRSGTRSTWLWALAQRQAGADVDGLIAKAGAQGYDLRPLKR